MVKKRNEGLSVSLLKYYITFLLVLGAIFIISYLYLGFRISKSIEENSVPIFDIISGEYEDYKSMDVSDLTRIGGYIEVLDNNRNVVYIAGESPKVKKTSYTEKELLDTFSMNGGTEYSVFINTIDKGEGDYYTVIIRMPADKMNLAVNLLNVPYSVGKPLYVLYIKVISVAVFLFGISIVIYSYWTAKKIKRPLKKIDEALGKVIEGDYEDKLVLNGEKEFVVISDTINYLIDKLKKSNLENKRLEESKTRMLMDLSHDIKTPITTIRGFSAALHEGLIDNEEQRERYYKTISTKSERVSELVNDLFELVKMESVQHKLIMEQVDICEFTRQIVVGYFDELQEREFELEINIPEIEILVKIDVNLFKRAITNLIENSIKYNGNGTKLRVEIREVGKIVILEIADNGVGIPDGIRGNLFDAFVRGDESRSSDGGSGLGLSIAKKIIENHGGEIKLVTRIGEEKTIFYISMYKI